MDSKVIELQKKWRLGASMAQGGFGRIYEGTAEDGSQVVIKLVPKAPGAARELLFEPVSSLPNVVPIIDSGEFEDSYVLVMPRAEKSLRQYLNDLGGKLAVDDAVRVLLDVAEALNGLRTEVVHRDLKPENILLYQGHWCLADFGIARYAEATTAPDTHKHSFTPAYAAPEQWRGEHATPATDVYAFGVVAFELLQGRRPFPGPGAANYREQHLQQVAPPLTGCPPSIAAIVTECLYKPAPTRPTSANILARLQASQRPTSPAAERLQAANQSIVEGQALAAAAASAKKSSDEKRRELFDIAQQSLSSIAERLADQILDAAPATIVTKTPNLRAQLGQAILTIESLRQAPPGCLAAYSGAAPCDVIAYTSIIVRRPQDRYGYEGRSHSLWFCDAHIKDVYRWFELAFMISPLVGATSSIAPFSLAPTEEEAAEAFWPVMSTRQVAWEPVPLDQGDEEQFIERWLGWFADAAAGRLSLPASLPESSGGHRRSP